MRAERLEYFVAVADTGHVGRAAQRLHISQPALSQQLRKLENHVGVDLLVRGPRGVELTPAGRALATRARRILRDLDRAETEARDLGSGRTGRVRIAYTRSASDRFTHRVVDRFRDRHPAVTVDTSSGWTALNVKQLIDGTLDAAFVRTPVTDPEIRCVTIAEQELVALLPRDHPVVTTRRVSPARLRRETFLFWPRAQAPESYDDTLRQLWGASPPTVTQTEPDGEQLVAAVEAGRGFTVMGEARAASFAAGRVHLQRLSGPARYSGVGVAVPVRSTNAGALAFLQTCIDATNG